MGMLLAVVAGLKAADAHDARSRGVASLARRLLMRMMLASWRGSGQLMLMMLALVGWLHLPEGC